MTDANYSRLPNWFVREIKGLTPTERMVWIVLSNRAGASGWNLSAQEIADEVGCDRRSITRAIPVLEACGLITREGRSNQIGALKNRYVVATRMPEMPPIETIREVRRAGQWVGHEVPMGGTQSPNPSETNGTQSPSQWDTQSLAVGHGVPRKYTQLDTSDYGAPAPESNGTTDNAGTVRAHGAEARKTDAVSATAPLRLRMADGRGRRKQGAYPIPYPVPEPRAGL